MSVEKKTTTHIEYSEINKNEQVIKRYLSISERMKKKRQIASLSQFKLEE